MSLAQEALGDDLEDIHAALSKRGAIRKSLSSSRLDLVPKGNGRTSDVSKDSEEEESMGRGSRHSEKKSTLSSRRSYDQLKDKQDSSRNSQEDSEEERRRRRRSDRRKNSQTDNFEGGKFNRSNSAIEKLLEYNEAGNYSVDSNDTFTKTKKKSKSSMNPLLIGLSKSRDSSTVKKTDDRDRERERRRRSSKSRERRRSSKSRERRGSSVSGRSKSRDRRGSSVSGRAGLRKGKQRDRSTSAQRSSSRSTRMKKIDDHDESPGTRPKVRRRGSSNSHHVHNKGKTSEKFTRGVKSLRATRSFMSRDEMRKENGVSKDAFERLWGEKNGAKDELNHSHNSANNSTQSNSAESSCASPTASPRYLSNSKLGNTTPKHKKTKLEKIHELQGQCDVFKSELEAMTEERDKLDHELKDGHREVSTLKKLVDAQEGQTAKLESKLAKAEEELELTRMEQRSERTDFSDAAKELAKVNIDYAKSVDEARRLKEELSGIQGKLAEREEKVSILEKELKASKENVQQLEADVLYADDQIHKLEAEVKKLEEEVALYSEAADRDGDGDNDGDNLREAKYEAERRKYEQRGKEIEEKNRLLEEEMKEFERQKVQHLEEQQLREKDFEEKQAREEEERMRREEEFKNFGEDRLIKEDETNKLLNELKDENAALNGRLKSEQLESTMKLQNKENIISELQAEVDRLAKEQQRRDSAPDSSPTLLVEIESLKTEATRRNSDYEDVRMKKVELEDVIEGLQNVNMEVKKRLSDVELEVAEHKKEVENQKRKTLEWQKKTGEWSEKAVVWKQRSEHWEKKAKESNSDNASSASDEASAEPQALFLAAAVEKKAVSAANANGSWRLGRRIFGMSSVDSEDEAQALINKLEGENILKEQEIKTLKSEMVKMQTSYKEQAYSKTQACEKIQKEMEALELKNTNLLKELELARKLNRTISESAMD